MSPTASDDDVLVHIPGSQLLHLVDRASGQVTLLATGPLNLSHDDTGVLAQVAGYTWALNSNIASLRSSDWTYTFQLPNYPGSYLCLVLAHDTPPDAIDLLQHVLASCSAYHHEFTQSAAPAVGGIPASAGPAQAAQPPRVPPAAAAGRPSSATDWGPATEPAAEPGGAQFADTRPRPADNIAAGLTKGGQVAGQVIMGAALLAVAGIRKGANAAVARMRPADQPATVSPEAQARLDKAHELAVRSAQFSGQVVEHALSATARLASSIAQRVGSSTTSARSQTAQDMRKVGVAGVEAMETVYNSLSCATRLVVEQSKRETTRVADHKYGQQAAQATASGMGALQGAVEAGLHLYKVRPTALARKVIKGTATEVVLGPRGAREGSMGEDGAATEAAGPGGSRVGAAGGGDPGHASAPASMTVQGQGQAQGGRTPAMMVAYVNAPAGHGPCTPGGALAEQPAQAAPLAPRPVLEPATGPQTAPAPASAPPAAPAVQQYQVPPYQPHPYQPHPYQPHPYQPALAQQQQQYPQLPPLALAVAVQQLADSGPVHVGPPVPSLPYPEAPRPGYYPPVPHK